MHFISDTDDKDARAERYWPDTFKQVIRKKLPQAIHSRLNEDRLQNMYKVEPYKHHPTLSQFVESVANIATIGAENGADDGFEIIYKALQNEAPLPEINTYARYLWPNVFSKNLRASLEQAIIEDYEKDVTMQHLFGHGYDRIYDNYRQFIDVIACQLLTSIMNGIDEALQRIYNAFIAQRTLPSARRKPRRLKIHNYYEH